MAGAAPHPGPLSETLRLVHAGKYSGVTPHADLAEVSYSPGLMTQTLMLWWRSTSKAERKKPSTACLVATSVDDMKRSLRLTVRRTALVSLDFQEATVQGNQEASACLRSSPPCMAAGDVGLCARRSSTKEGAHEHCSGLGSTAAMDPMLMIAPACVLSRTCQYMHCGITPV